MELFSISATKHTPEIIFDLKARQLSFKGVSLPENAFVFFNPLTIWLDKNKTNISMSDNTLKIIIDLEYLNSSSLKFIVSFVRHCLSLTPRDKLLIEWHYDSDDDDSLEKANDMANVIDHPVCLQARSC